MHTHTQTFGRVSATNTIATPKRVSSSGFTLRMFFEVLLKAVEMKHAVPDTGRVTAQQMAKIRAIAETI